jgi:hypothetical protein
MIQEDSLWGTKNRYGIQKIDMRCKAFSILGAQAYLKDIKDLGFIWDSPLQQSLILNSHRHTLGKDYFYSSKHSVDH